MMLYADPGSLIGPRVNTVPMGVGAMSFVSFNIDDRATIYSTYLHVFLSSIDSQDLFLAYVFNKMFRK